MPEAIYDLAALARGEFRDLHGNPLPPIRLWTRADDPDAPTGYCTDHGEYDPTGDCPGCVAEEAER